MLPLDMVNALADLIDPAAVAKEMPWLAGEMAKIALGKSEIALDKRDKRFADEAVADRPSTSRATGRSPDRLSEMRMVADMHQSVEALRQNKARARSAGRRHHGRARPPTGSP